MLYTNNISALLGLCYHVIIGRVIRSLIMQMTRLDYQQNQRVSHVTKNGAMIGCKKVVRFDGTTGVQSSGFTATLVKKWDYSQEVHACWCNRFIYNITEQVVSR